MVAESPTVVEDTARKGYHHQIRRTRDEEKVAAVVLE
jgi:hypothetical protein